MQRDDQSGRQVGVVGQDTAGSGGETVAGPPGRGEEPLLAGIDLASREGTEFMPKQLRIWLGMDEGELMETAWTPPKE